jgi:hypothetical protein
VRFCLLFLFILICCNSCTHDNGHVAVHSFYYWKTTVSNGDITNQKIAKDLGINHFYVRFMDVDWDEVNKKAIPKGIIRCRDTGTPFFTKFNYTPVVFITNRTFINLSPEGADTLAIKVSDKIKSIKQQITGTNFSDTTVGNHNNITPEIQIDCDWTSATMAAYFHFLRQLKIENKNSLITATIRLYPYKYYKKMGTPPVDRGILMCYNTGNITDHSTRNSIFDEAEVMKYFGSTAYPLPLDLALPIFKWNVWFRNGRYKGIIHGHQLNKYISTVFVQTTGNNYTCNADTVIEDHYFRLGDEIRIESPGASELQSVTAKVLHQLPYCQRIAFFEWDTSNINPYEKPIKDIYSRY